MAVSFERKTNETSISAELDFGSEPEVNIETGVPFFDHMLHSFAFHGRMRCSIRASGDIEVDPHHLVEDVGIVLGECMSAYVERNGPVVRYGQAAIPMDDALSQAVVDIGGRPYLVYHANFPQPRVGDFDVSLVREFLLGLTTHGKLNLHAECRYGENSHHMIESLFKAMGRAISLACAKATGGVASTKGVI